MGWMKDKADGLAHMAGSKIKENESYLQAVVRRFRYHKAGFVCFWIVVVIVLVSLIGPFFLPYGPNEITPAFSAAPSADHWLGTDQIGRDVLSRLLYGTKISLLVGILSTIIATGVGAVLGLLAGYFGGIVDGVVMRFTDMVMSFPYILLILVAATIFKPGMWNIILILGFLDWPGMARLVRGNVMTIRNADYVHASQIAGMSKRYILFSDILPNVMAPILVFGTSVIAISILDESALSFLGMGVQPPVASLGNMLNGAQSLTVLTSKLWLWMPPGLMIVVLVICFNFIGDALRDAIDPATTK